MTEGQYQKATYARISALKATYDRRSNVPKGLYQSTPSGIHSLEEDSPLGADPPERTWDQTGSDIIPPRWIDKQVYKHYLPATFLAGDNESNSLLHLHLIIHFAT